MATDMLEDATTICSRETFNSCVMVVKDRNIFQHLTNHLNTTRPPPPKMTAPQLAPRPLFGGAIAFAVPTSYHDARWVRPRRSLGRLSVACH